MRHRVTRARSPNRFQRLVIITGILAAVVLLGVLVAVPPIIMKDMITGPIAYDRVYSPGEFGLTADTLTLQTSDGLRVAPYAVHAPQPQAVVIFVSGIHNPPVTAFYGHAKMLLDYGYSSVLVEMRAHGDSEGRLIALGYMEYRDILAAVDYIRGEPEYAGVPIVAYGLSMGGATAINAIGKTSQIDGLIALSAYSSWESNFRDNLTAMGAPRIYAALQQPFVRVYTTFRYGWSSFANRPIDNIAKLGDRPALLIHSTGDTQIPFANLERLAAKAPAHVETWVREGDLHLIVKEGGFLRPGEDEEYYKRIIGFLDRHFGPAPATIGAAGGAR